MPMIQIHMLPGRTTRRSARCLKAIHEAVTSTLGVPDSAVRAWITDMDPHAFIRAGEIVADRAGQALDRASRRSACGRSTGGRAARAGRRA